MTPRSSALTYKEITKRSINFLLVEFGYILSFRRQHTSATREYWMRTRTHAHIAALPPQRAAIR